MSKGLDIYKNLFRVEDKAEEENPCQQDLVKVDSDTQLTNTKDKLIVVTFKLPLIIEKVKGKW